MKSLLKTQIMKRDMTRASICRALGVDYSTVFRWEKYGLKSAPLGKVVHLAHLLDCDISELYELEDGDFS